MEMARSRGAGGQQLGAEKTCKGNLECLPGTSSAS
jgi:hypothetical protein